MPLASPFPACCDRGGRCARNRALDSLKTVAVGSEICDLVFSMLRKNQTVLRHLSVHLNNRFDDLIQVLLDANVPGDPDVLPSFPTGFTGIIKVHIRALEQLRADVPVIIPVVQVGRRSNHRRLV